LVATVNIGALLRRAKNLVPEKYKKQLIDHRSLAKKTKGSTGMFTMQ